jgi:integrase
MSIFKRGNVYWFHFWQDSEHYQQSTKQGNPRRARQMEAAFRTRLSMEGVGIVERKKAPLFTDFADRFLKHVEVRNENKPATVQFYTSKLERLREFGPLASVRLDRVDESLIERYVVARREKVSAATVNRELATLRRMLRVAEAWDEIIRAPKIRLLKGEREREFVLARTIERLYLSKCPMLLADIAILILETGMRIGEALNLEWTDVRLEPLGKARFGYLRVREGKSKNARRTIPLTDRASALLRRRKKASKHSLVFANREGDRYLGTSINHLHQKVRDALNDKEDGRKGLNLPKDFVLHSLRHTMLSRLGEAGVDAFTIMRIAGHSSITVSQRYVHPSPEAVERAMERLHVVAAEPKRLQPATFSATSTKAGFVSH